MANRRIDQLNPNLNPLTGAELIPIFDTNSNTTERISITTLGDFIDSTNDTFINAVGFSNSNDLLTLYRNDGSNLSTTIGRYNRWYVPSGQTLTIPSNFQSFIYGDFYIEGTLFLDDNSQMIVINGDIILTGGTISGSGTTYLIDLPEYNSFVTNGVYNLTTKSIDFTGNFGFTPFSVDLSSISVTSTYTTGATLNGNVIEFNRNDLTNAYSVDLSSLVFTGNTFDNPIVNFYVSNIYGNSPITFQDSIQSTGSTASGILSFAFGSNTLASGDNSHAEGYQTVASGYTSHAEGGLTVASGAYSHAEGGSTKSNGNSSHAEGYNTIANGSISHAEGASTEANGDSSHAEGRETIANGDYSHSEGYGTIALAPYSHSQGAYTIAGGDYSHAGGFDSVASGQTSFIHSTNSIVLGDRSAVLGGDSIVGLNDDTVYVPNLNINTTPSNDDALTQVLVRDTDGTIKYRLSTSLGGSINYSNITWVDAVNGSDSTGEVGNFTKPYLTIGAAVTACNAVGYTSTNRGMIYIRKGNYTDIVYLYANIDFYAEPGVNFTNNGFRDTTTTGQVSIYGYANFIGTNVLPLLSVYSSNIYMEFDTCTQNASSSIGAIEITPNSTYSSTIVIKCNKIYSNAINAYGITIRGNTNVTITANEIKAPYQVIYLRYSTDGTNFNGTLTVNCPRIVCESGGWAGNVAAYKNCYNQLRLDSTAVVTINGNFINETPFVGQYTIVSSQGNTESFTLNGNIIGNESSGYNVNGTASKFTHNGNITSGGYCIITNGTTEVKVINGTLRRIGAVATYATIATLAGTSKVYFINSNLINLNIANGTNSNPTSTVYLYNVTYYSNTAGTYICNGGNIGANNVISNYGVSGTTNVFTTLGITVDTLFTLPQF